LVLSVAIVCWHCLLPLSVGIVYWYCLLPLSVAIVCCHCLLVLSIAIVCWHCLLPLSVASFDDTLVSSNFSYNIETPLYEGIAVTTNKMKYSL
jgi:hypothetical protein